MKESPIFVKTFDFLKWVLGHTEKFPKTQRFFLAKRLNDALFDFYELLSEAVLLKDGQHRQTLRAADVRLMRTRHYLRLAMELHYLNLRQYEYAAGEIQEIGRLLGGWLKKATPPAEGQGRSGRSPQQEQP